MEEIKRYKIVRIMLFPNNRPDPPLLKWSDVAIRRYDMLGPREGLPKGWPFLWSGEDTRYK